MTRIESLLDAAKRSLTAGDVVAAMASCNAACAANPSDPRPFALQYEIALRRGRFDEAVASAARAAQLAPAESLFRLLLSRALLQAGRRRDALDAAEAGARVARSQPAVLDGLGSIFSVCGDQKRALTLFDRAVRAEPGNADFLFNLATAQRMTGALASAEETCDRAIAINPRDCQAYYLRSDLRRQTAGRNHVEAMQALVDSGVDNWRSEVLLRYALAKETEDLGEYERSFRHLKAGADLHRRHIKYDVRDDIATLDAIVRLHSRAALQNVSVGHDTKEPIFIVGLPRTGTTLLERMAASHSAVVSAGELNEFPLALVRAAAQANKRVDRMELIHRSLEFDMGALGRSYLEASRPQNAGLADRFIDKMPQNYLYCGLIHASLPKAKIILLARNPMDTCYAIYKAHFTGAYPFSYDLEDIGAYYLAYRRLVAHWKTVLPPTALMEVSYEKMVAEPDDTARSVLQFVNLGWEEAVGRFHENASPSTTASATQVRQPVYSSSVGKWRHLARELEPLRLHLAQELSPAELDQPG